jgi:DNA repair protein SbcC/Rad50
MRICRLHLRNYRVFERPVDLELPSGLIGIYGPNGAGKSALLESVLFALWGRARTSRDEIRTAGVNGEALAEVEFEHEGHLYLVGRSVSGMSATVRAEALADGEQVAEGAHDTSRYVQSILGMDVKAFRSSVFAEQGQLASFSANQPNERRALVLQLLGVTPLDAARDEARKRAREARERLGERRAGLPDLAELTAVATRCEEELGEAKERLGRRDADRQEAESAWRARDEELERLRRLESVYKELVAEGRAARSAVDTSRRRVDELEVELAELRGVECDLAKLGSRADGLDEAERLLAVVVRLEQARSALSEIGPLVAPDAPGDGALVAARRASQSVAKLEAELTGRLDASEREIERAQSQLTGTEQLSGEASCPLCGQELGDAFELVLAHGREELARARQRAARLRGEAAEARAELDRCRDAEAASEEGFRAARERWEQAREESLRREELQRQLADANEAATGLPPVQAEDGSSIDATAGTEAVSSEVDRRRRARDECNRLAGRLERRGAVEAELEIERERLAGAESQVAGLLDKVSQLGFRPDSLEKAAREAAAARNRALGASEAAKDAAVAAATTGERLESARAALEAAREDHRRLDELEDELRHVGRTADLLASFRNEVVASIGPRLSTQAAELFAELTDHEYDRLEVDPETFEIHIRDHGFVYGMDRFSGSETDLANLALRVAISEHVRFQSGGTVGLLVLDEVFGPLDEDRKARMLLALERLRGRFRQILVVTHDAGIKDQLGAAIEVVKLPGRRAEARLV